MSRPFHHDPEGLDPEGGVRGAGHRNFVSAVAFAADGRAVASASYDGTLKLWDAATGELCATVPLWKHQPYSWCRTLCFTSGGREVLAASDSSSGILDLEEHVWRDTPAEPAAILCVSPAGQALAMEPRSRLSIHDLAGWRRIAGFSTSCEHWDAAALAPDGAAVALAVDGCLTLLDARSGKVLWSIPFRQRNSRLTVSWSPDSKTIACADGWDRPRLLEARSGRLLAKLGDERRAGVGRGIGRPGIVLFSPDGRTVATAGDDGRISLWDTETCNLRGTLAARDVFTNHTDPETASGARRPAAHEGLVRCLAFSNDGEALASGGDEGVVKLWDTRSAEERIVLGRRAYPVTCLAAVPDGSLAVAGGGDGVLRAWDLETGALVGEARAHAGRVAGVAVLPGGRRVASGGRNGCVEVRELPELRLVATLADGEGTIFSVAASADGAWIAWGGQRDEARGRTGFAALWDARRGVPGPEMNEWGEVSFKTAGGYWSMRAVALSPDGAVLAAAMGREVRLLETRSGRPLATLRSEGDRYASQMRSLAFSPDGALLAGGTFGYAVVLRDARTGEARGTIRARRDSIGAIAFSPDLETIAIATDYDETVWLHHLRSGELCAELQGHVHAVRAVAYSAGGALLASAGADGLVKVWDARSRRLLRSLSC